MECWTSILDLTFGTSRTAQFSTFRADRNLPQGNSSLLISIRFWVDTSAGEGSLSVEYKSGGLGSADLLHPQGHLSFD